MKYSHKATYDADGDANTADVTKAYCRRIINEDIGFTQRIDEGKYYEFGLDFNQDQTRVMGNIFRQTMQCQNAAGTNLDAYFDLELQSCILKGAQMGDYSVHNIQAVQDSVVLRAIANSDYLNWNLNISIGMNRKQYIFPSINQCIINGCDDPNTDGTCNSGQIEASGYLRYYKNHDGSIGWFCESS